MGSAPGLRRWRAAFARRVPPGRAGTAWARGGRQRSPAGPFANDLRPLTPSAESSARITRPLAGIGRKRPAPVASCNSNPGRSGDSPGRLSNNLRWVRAARALAADGRPLNPHQASSAYPDPAGSDCGRRLRRPGASNPTARANLGRAAPAVERVHPVVLAPQRPGRPPARPPSAPSPRRRARNRKLAAQAAASCGQSAARARPKTWSQPDTH